MELGITIPLQKFLGLPRPEPGTCPDPFFCWEVHRQKLGRGRIVMIAMNASNRFVAVTSMTAADWKRWQAVCVQTITDSLAISGFSQDLIGAYLAVAGVVERREPGRFWWEGTEVTRTHGRSPVGFLNRLVDHMWLAEPASQISIWADTCYRLNNAGIAKVPTRDDWVYPAQAFADDLRERGIV